MWSKPIQMCSTPSFEVIDELLDCRQFGQREPLYRRIDAQDAGAASRPAPRD